jgi:hypothetical protein
MSYVPKPGSTYCLLLKIWIKGDMDSFVAGSYYCLGVQTQAKRKSMQSVVQGVLALLCSLLLGRKTYIHINGQDLIH